MASKVELIAEIESIDDSIETEQLSHKELTLLLDELKAQPDETPAPPRTGEFYVAAGKAIGTSRGIRSDGEAIDPADVDRNDIEAGRAILEGFVESGHVVRGEGSE